MEKTGVLPLPIDLAIGLDDVSAAPFSFARFAQRAKDAATRLNGSTRLEGKSDTLLEGRRDGIRRPRERCENGVLVNDSVIAPSGVPRHGKAEEMREVRESIAVKDEIDQCLSLGA
jgi:hypothetical protein